MDGHLTERVWESVARGKAEISCISSIHQESMLIIISSMDVCFGDVLQTAFTHFTSTPAGKILFENGAFDICS